MSTTPYPFEQLVRDKAEQQAAEAEELHARQQASTLAHQALQSSIHDLHQTIFQRNLNHEGTPPQEALGAEAERLCSEFLEFMAARNYPGSQALSAWSLKKGLLASKPTIGWSTRGYPIGYNCVPNGDLSAISPSAQLRHSVYLCIDGNLRSVPDIPDRHLSVVDLPVDIAGKPLPIQIGYYTEERRQVSGNGSGHDSPGRHCYADFNPRHLDHLLAELAVPYL